MAGKRKRKKVKQGWFYKGNRIYMRVEGKVYTIPEFITTFCPNFSYISIQSRRDKYTPIELIILYNAAHTPVYEPNTNITYKDIQERRIEKYRKTMAKNYKSKKEKALEDRNNSNLPKIKRTPIT